ncbi:MAG: hypothetical protein HY587_04590 [Candidatus Omnitrophica bacterium]|nr:hypothetical protein [Candidatus Omnitrophota bacterium]
MSLSLKCDFCKEAIADFPTPIGFTIGGKVEVRITVEQGNKSLDLCRTCFTLLLADCAGKVAPKEVDVAEHFVRLACSLAPEGTTYRREGWLVSMK